MSVGKVALCGDFNARTGKLCDYDSIQGKDINNGIASYHTDFPLTDRHTEDNKVNTYGRELIALCKSSKMRIMNGFFINDNSTGQFTCCTSRGTTSLIDYLVCDHRFMNELKEFSLSPITVDSDHKRLSFSIRESTQCETEPVEIVRTEQTKSFYKYIYQDDKVSGYLSSLDDKNCLKLLDELPTVLSRIKV